MAAAATLHAADVRPLLKAGFDFGGDTVAAVQFSDGTTQSIKANEGFHLGGGVSILSEARTVETELSVAYKFRLINPRNGDASWTRVPLEALVFYRWPRARLGGGLAYHLKPKLWGRDIVGGLDVKFDDAAGAVLQADYLLTQSLAVGLRYTRLEYRARDGSSTFQSNGPGVTASFRF